MPRRPQIYYLSRTITCLVGLLSIGTLFIPLSNPLLMVVDVLVRTYLIFLGTVMAHESVHGHLGRTKAANFWWGRVALIPSMVPFTNFRKTHQLHHTHTNIPDQDPDHFMKSRNFLELFVRALAMPHHWFFWLHKRGRIKRGDVIELVLNYLAIVLVFSVVLAFVGRNGCSGACSHRWCSFHFCSGIHSRFRHTKDSQLDRLTCVRTITTGDSCTGSRSGSRCIACITSNRSCRGSS